MNLLEATTILIERVEATNPEDSKTVQALKRIKKRLFVLQVRHAKARKRVRVKAFWNAVQYFKGGRCNTTNRACFQCPNCQRKIYFGDFLRNAEWSGGGRFTLFSCPHCICITDPVVGHIP